jgi:hypothetical protein
MKIEKKEQSVIEIQEEVKISQDGKDLILEKGDKIEILKERDYDFDLKELLESVDFSYLLRSLNSLRIPVKEISAEVNRRAESFYASGGKFFGRELGIFMNAVKEVELETFNSTVKYDKDGRLVWWATWALTYTILDGGTNGMTFLTTWYYFDDMTWVERKVGR